MMLCMKKIPKVESNNGNPKKFDKWPAEVF